MTKTEDPDISWKYPSVSRYITFFVMQMVVNDSPVKQVCFQIMLSLTCWWCVSGLWIGMLSGAFRFVVAILVNRFCLFPGLICCLFFFVESFRCWMSFSRNSLPIQMSDGENCTNRGMMKLLVFLCLEPHSVIAYGCVESSFLYRNATWMYFMHQCKYRMWMDCS